MSMNLVPFPTPILNNYAIDLNTNDFKHVQDFGNKAAISFNWRQVVKSVEHTKNDMFIEASKFNPQRSNEEIKSLVNAAYQTKKIKKYDRIFATLNQKIEKIGYVTSKDILEKTSVVLSINWFESKLEDVALSLFKEDSLIQGLNNKALKIISNQYNIVLEQVNEEFQDTEYFSNTYKTIERNTESKYLNDKQDPGGKIRLFYGTNRKPADKIKNIQNYGNVEGDLQYGICEVNIPQGHKQGQIESPLDFWVFKFLENPQIHVVVQKIEQMNYSSFMHHFSETLKITPKKNALLFVHGYNNSFEDAAKRTAQLAWDLRFDGFTGFFSWPSAAEIKDYFKDEAVARTSVSPLVQFLELLILETELEQLHIIAHSMGSLVTTLSLNELRNLPSVELQIEKIKQLILGAPDIDQGEFRSSILPKFKKIGLRRTLYTSDHDIAMKASSSFRSGRLRLGQVAENIFLEEGIETVEASNVLSESTHGYLFKSDPLLNDLFYLINENLSPSKRRLREIKVNPLQYWLFS